MRISETIKAVLLTALLAVAGWQCQQIIDLKADMAAVKAVLHVDTATATANLTPKNRS